MSHVSSEGMRQRTGGGCVNRASKNVFLRETERTARRQFSRLVLIAILLYGFFLSAGTDSVQAAVKRMNILMVGNSLTYSAKHHNVTIPYLMKLGTAGGYSLSVSRCAYDNEKLKIYAKASTRRGREVRNLIRKKKWDVIVLQENTDWAVARGGTFGKAAKKLASYIRKNCPGARILLDCTWPYDRNKRISWVWYSKKTQRKNMLANYKAVGKSINAEVVYTGKAFAAYEKTKEARNLYRWDKNHLSYAGCYLHACCLYRAITGKSPAGLSYTGAMSRGVSKAMQKAAAAHTMS